jgi:response regulator RpfG family c-di-GMP phosphodiesterase
MSDAATILVLDDEPSTSRVLQKILAKAGYHAIELNDPTKLEDHLLFRELNLVITDLMMPKRNGLEVLKIVRASKPEVPVIIVTGRATIDAAIEATKLGVAEFLSKPIGAQALLDAVKKHIITDDILPDPMQEVVARQGFRERKSQTAESDLMLLPEEIVSTETIPEGYVEVAFEHIEPGNAVPFNLFIQLYNKSTQKYYLRRLCNKNEVYTSTLRNILFRRRLQYVFIQENDYRAYLSYYSSIKALPHFQQDRVQDKKKLVLYGKAIEAIGEILADPINEKSVEKATDLVDTIFRAMVMDPGMYDDMYKLFSQDPSIFNHSANVCLLALSFSLHLHYDLKMSRVVGVGALFHDVGMRNVPKEILEKSTPLTAMEWALIKEHPEVGYHRLKSHLSLHTDSLRIVYEHHEESDGSGYPRGLKGSQISPLTAICHIVDKFDGMTTAKPYRAAFPPSDALKTIYFQEKSKEGRDLVRRFTEFLGGKKHSD